MFDRIASHLGHRVVVAVYGGDHNAAVECEDCSEVIIDADREGADD